MAFVLGDRRQALELVRDAMNLFPKLPAGQSLLFALEASTVKPGDEEKLRPIIKRMDSLLLTSPLARRGRWG